LKSGITDPAATAALNVAFRNPFHATLPEKQSKDMPRFYLGREIVVGVDIVN
jgi:hypothetical protein